MRILKALLESESGQDLAEYAIALGIVAVFVAAIAIAIGGEVNTLWSNAQPAIQSVVDGES